MLAGKTYVPILRARIAEVEAFRQLSAEAKELVFPIFLLRPWPNANHLSLAVDRIVEAAAGHPFGLGLDREKYLAGSPKPAQAEFDELFSDHQGYRAYFDFIEEIPGAVPVLQATTNADQLLLQLGRAEELDRGLIVHQQRGTMIPITQSVISLPPLPHDTIFVVDAAWSRDALQMQAWALPVAQNVVAQLPDAEIVVASSSFPDSFGHIIGDMEEQAFEGQIYGSVRLNLQSANLTLGDWGSTRPSQSGGGGKIPSRIDIPRPNSWQIFRADPDGDYGFLEVAQEATTHPCFAAVPDCWGKLQVGATDGNGAGITGVKMNTSCRINMHMTIKSGASHGIEQDEQPYQD
ncbi:hypothetical protein GCM10023232_18740 [Sphingosinicella ginsenosidimutans]|uniref:Uncharacterized protein n=1 Tax=Allosphingosinicella ginsenosidimutans TaxID=1176539 RepID=A0A5C6TT83_9SPHN|nr:hypothetical protein [Sphingosinicella ginsenosidimutans]TXC62918.1 hypothetical protein FRZ32_04085 [Sphingosinicella ginsenosidimutans]